MNGGLNRFSLNRFAPYSLIKEQLSLLAITLKKDERIAILQKDGPRPTVIGAIVARVSGSRSLLGISLPKEILVLREKHLDEFQQADLHQLLQGKAAKDADFEAPHSH